MLQHLLLCSMAQSLLDIERSITQAFCVAHEAQAS
jgi:hypothetical protein